MGNDPCVEERLDMTRLKPRSFKHWPHSRTRWTSESLFRKPTTINRPSRILRSSLDIPTCLERLVGWNIDLTIADVNGFTALHCAYKKGDRACVDLLLEKGASETVLDALGRAPSHLMPEGFASLNDHDTDMTSDDQPKLEQKRDAPSLFQSTDSGHGPRTGGFFVVFLWSD
jgi:ankyrin repeat protein